MRKPLLIIALFCSLASCKKTIEQVEQDLVLQAMTDGQWKITHFVNNGTDISAAFDSYRFKYYSNKTVDAINNGVVEKTGTWDGSQATNSTSANFINANYPLNLVNGTWHIDHNSWTYVEATQTIGTDVRTMRLDKQ